MTRVRDEDVPVRRESTVLRKAVAVGMSALVGSLLGITPAVAQSEIVPPELGGVGAQPGGTTVTPPGGTAFTGADVQVWMLLAAVALVAGIWLVIAARRRARADGA